MASLHVRIGPSRCLAGLLVLVHALACAILYPLALPETLKLVFAVAIAVSGIHSVLKTALLRSHNAIVALEIGDDGAALRERYTGQWQACRVLGTTFVSSPLTVLNLELVNGGAVRHVVLLPDNVGRDDFRRLRVRLRWSGAAAVEPVATKFFDRAIRRTGRSPAVDAAEE
jgi:toxin CptA